MAYQVPKLLEDMRFIIYENPGEEWLAEALGPEKVLREMFRDKPRLFLEQLHQLERDHQRARAMESKRKSAEKPKVPKAKTAEVDVDMGTMACVALVEKLIGELVEEQAKEDAELAERPNAAEIGGTLQRSLKGALERESMLRERVKDLERTAAAKASA